MLTTVISIGNLLSSLAFGALWFALGLRSAVHRLRRRPWRWRSPPPCRCCCARSGRPDGMDSRNGKILAAIVVLCVARQRRLRRVRRARPELDDHRRPARGQGAVLADSDLMVRAVDPKDPRLNGRVYEVEDGKVHHDRRSRLRAGLLRRRARDLHGDRSLRGRLRRDDLQPEDANRAHDRAHRPALAGAGLRRRPLRGDDGLRHRRLLPLLADRLLHPHDDPRDGERQAGRPAGAVQGDQGRQAVRCGRLQLLGGHLRSSGLQSLLRHPGHRRRALPGRRRCPREVDADAARQGSSARRSRRTASRSPTRAGSATRLAGTCACSTWRRSKTTPSPRTARSTTRSSGWTTTPLPTRTKRTSTRSLPTAVASRSCWSRDATSPVRLTAASARSLK